MQSIKKISAIETFPVRHPVLRSEKPIESCHFEGDDLETTTHFGLFDENKLIGVISIFEAKNKLFSEEKQFQIRGMAVLNEHQKKGLGASLVEHSEKYCLDNDSDLIWFNARTEATGFYEKMNYQKIGSSFEIKEVGEHFVMFKKIKANPFQN
ncbi:GNAT family N-acetyltransferase [Flavobacterium maritimum]|uniref:GNAT family N-acetyltransferase n=1 Tax=Flavobacterium maritimum TaxID=3149042 RepID=UPI0032B4E4F5